MYAAWKNSGYTPGISPGWNNISRQG